MRNRAYPIAFQMTGKHTSVVDLQNFTPQVARWLPPPHFTYSQVTRAALILLCLCLLSGCETPPPYTHVDDTEAGLEATGADRDEYQWNFDYTFSNGYATFNVLKPLSFAFFDEVDKEHLKKAVAELNRRKFSPLTERPDGLSDMSQLFLARMLGPNKPKPVTLRIPISDKVSKTGFALSGDGSSLLTAGIAIQLWDVAEGKQVASLPISSPASQVFFAPDNQCLVVKENSIELVSLSDGEINGRWQAPREILNCSISNDLKTLGCVTEDMKLTALSWDLELLGELTSLRLSSSDCAVHPTGDWIIASCKDGPVRWYLDGLIQEAEVLPAIEFTPEDTICVSGAFLDRWIGSKSTVIYKGSEHLQPLGPNPYGHEHVVLPRVFQALAANHQDVEGSWIFALEGLPLSDGTWRYRIQDFEIESGHSSAPLMLPGEPRWIAADQAARTVAVSTDSELSVFQRTSFIDLWGEYSKDSIVSVLTGQPTEQFEKCLKIIRSSFSRRGKFSGEALYSKIMWRAGVAWALAIYNDENLELRKKLDAWHSEGSEAALACSAICHTELARSAQYGAEYEKYARRAQADLQTLLELPKPPAVAFSAKVAYLINVGGAKRVELDPYLLESTRLYPTEWGIHVTILTNLYAMRNGSREKLSYINSLSNLYPDEFGDYLYASMLNECTVIGGYNYKRYMSGMETQVARGHFTPLNFYAYFKLVETLPVDQTQTSVEDYVVRTFDLLPAEAYREGAIKPVINARARLFEKTKQAASGSSP